jgi:arsenite methyltransferase
LTSAVARDADVCIAALLVGPNGLVIGLDFTPAMVEKARTNSKLAALHSIAIHEADIADLPLSDACADVVISNGANQPVTMQTMCTRESVSGVAAGGSPSLSSG